jgi:hypothetical protein
MSANTPFLVVSTLTKTSAVGAYVGGQVVAPVTALPITFAGVVQNNGCKGRISGCQMVDQANQAVKGVFELWLFTAPPVSPPDQSAFIPTNTELDTLIAVIPLSTAFVGNSGAGAAGNVVYISPPLDFPFACPTNTSNLFGLLIVRNGYTPVANEVFVITLDVDQVTGP